MENEKLKDLILRSFQEAKKDQDSDLTSQDLHRKRSQEWVKVLARNFRKCYSNQDDEVRVFSKDFGEHRAEFKVNELLYDIAVCQVGETPSAQKGKRLTYIQEALWVVESEMARDSHEAIIDFSKLVMGTPRINSSSVRRLIIKATSIMYFWSWQGTAPVKCIWPLSLTRKIGINVTMSPSYSY